MLNLYVLQIHKKNLKNKKNTFSYAFKFLYIMTWTFISNSEINTYAWSVALPGQIGIWTIRYTYDIN
jgi:hypothetical protein